MSAIAIIGMACRYPEARSPHQLWENVLAQRRSFRRIPQVRLRLADYLPGEQAEDRIYLKTAAVLEDYEFDRVRFHVSKDTFASTDLVHWLALDVASQALEDAKLLDVNDFQRERTGVYVGNSLTGEFSRANLLRLRWPYVRRVLSTALERSLPSLNGDLDKLIDEIEQLYKSPFPSTGEESLAGGLSNTIAGRICNYFNFKGGGYTVDAACASSLLAVTTACSALESGDVDIAVAGGVDLSLDPFELAGFSKLGALAGEKMRVFDARSAGFWPGEGCGMVVLMRHEDAVAHHHAPYAVLRGWGISSDGNGGLTRPELSGQLLALRRAYQRAGYGADVVAYFEGHGTGTAVGDAVELQALSSARREARSDAAPAALGSIKANIGHTKAAAGVAGLIKATLAVQSRILPPTSGCDTPHPELTVEKPMLRVLKTGELWPEDAQTRAGVSAMGFGGINTHVTLEAADAVRRRNFTGFEQRQLASPQDCELFLFQAEDAKALAAQLEEILQWVGEISLSEMTDFAACLTKQIAESASRKQARAACVASTPDELEEKIRKLAECCQKTKPEINASQGTFFSDHDRRSRIGFLFTGQGAPVRIDGGIWSRRFPGIRELYVRANLPKSASVATEIAQPCVVTASLAGLHALNLCGIRAHVALGHSLGEITALHWAGACEQDTLLRIVRERGRLMAQIATEPGAMASIRAGCEEVQQRLNGDPLNIAAYNSPLQTVVSGEANSVREFAARLSADGLRVTPLAVSHAFHSPLMADMATEFSAYLARERFGCLNHSVVSTVAPGILAEDTNLHQLLTQQITAPVQFARALAIAAAEVDLFIEVGPGDVLTSIAAECTDKPVIALNVAADSLRGLLLAAGAAFVSSAQVRPAALFENRFVRPFDLKRRHTFLQNPCETVFDSAAPAASLPQPRPSFDPISAEPENSLDTLRKLVAQRTELPLASIRPQDRFLDDLHLNSITVSQIILEATTQLNLAPPAAPAEYANATIAQAAETLEAIRKKGPAPKGEKFPQGVDSWIRVLTVEFTPRERRSVSSHERCLWQIMATQEHPLRPALETAFRNLSGNGVVICVPPQRDGTTAGFLLQSAGAALKQNVQRVIFVGTGAAALARTLFLENPTLKVAVVHVPQEHPKAAEWIAQEASSVSQITEVRYDDTGVRRESTLKLLWPEESGGDIGLGPQDVLLVTGGGKGIAAECALALARESQCCLALLGRSDPQTDQELKNNLSRLTESGISFRYFAADVADADDTRRAIKEIEQALGSMTAVLHGAGNNTPRRLGEISDVDLDRTLAPKFAGLNNVLSALDPERLRLLVTFGSIIARSGLHGEGHYGLANEWLTEMVERWQQEHPSCRCLNLEWSVWAGAGMGQRLGVLDSLIRQGISPLPLDEAIRALKTMLAWKQAPVSSIVTSRFGKLPTLQFPERELPLRRFLEYVEIYYPGIELIADATLSLDTDPYVADHVFQGEQLLPAVCGIEAMVQAAMALEETDQLPELCNLRLEHPIVVPSQKSVTIRIAALRRRPGTVSLAIRCSGTSFQLDHFTAECVFGGQHEGKKIRSPEETQTLALDPARDLYGRILFHQGRFRRVKEYRRLQADESLAELNPPAASAWFARHLPSGLAAGDPASRDAALHSIQACIPHRTILPVGVDRMVLSAKWTRDRASVHAVERVRDGNNFLYDLKIHDAEGRVCEYWQGLHLRAVSPIAPPQTWPLPLLAPYLERMLGEHTPTRVRVALEHSREQNNIDHVIRRLIGQAKLAHRPDGKPEIPGQPDTHISLSHSANFTLIAIANQNVGCDMEQIVSRDLPTWKQLLGEEWFSLATLIAEKSALSLDAAATEMWTLKESLRKAGAGLDCSARLVSAETDGWRLFSAGKFAAATFHTCIENATAGFCFGFVIGKTS